MLYFILAAAKRSVRGRQVGAAGGLTCQMLQTSAISSPARLKNAILSVKQDKSGINYYMMNLAFVNLKHKSQKLAVCTLAQYHAKTTRDNASYRKSA